MNCSNPVRLNFKNNKYNLQGIKTATLEKYPEGLTVPCGKCIFCRIQKRKEWSIRMLHEIGEHERNSFITLTYSDTHLPDNNSLRKRDLQLFIKRLRKNLNGRRIKYFACGEYGSKTDRPHYHAILFGVGLHKDDKQLVIDSWPFCDWSNNIIRTRSFGLAEPDSIRYVAQYIDKKFSGDLAHEEYERKKRDSVFRILSLGIGSNYCDRFGSEFTKNGFITVNGVKHSIPRYYLKRLQLNAEELNSLSAYTKECDVIHHYTGFDYSYDEAYKYLNASEVLKYEQAIKDAKSFNKATIEAKLRLKESKL